MASYLVLSRKKDESIIIGDNIKVTLLEIRGDKVRIGIDAPRNLSVHREEVYYAIKREQVAEAATDVRGLAGADAEMDLLRNWDGQDDQVLLRKMQDEMERDGV